MICLQKFQSKVNWNNTTFQDNSKVCFFKIFHTYIKVASKLLTQFQTLNDSFFYSEKISWNIFIYWGSLSEMKFWHNNASLVLIWCYYALDQKLVPNSWFCWSFSSLNFPSNEFNVKKFVLILLKKKILQEYLDVVCTVYCCGVYHL